ncbi:Fe-S protein assembly chaperone HscA [Wolbachia endosymbiont of Diaphorina citri]|jgi:Molecular chaperone|uniref:Fe-S protein assembly chaperone HscA n=1 Tax=Wolbachia endosymbiont of Diaphorina citri TaxID=116598 RepID=UPI000318DBD1|nr:Fe-S protein assembly chaperone HscA [Wolbachia endosymbiont of Diaphorina citri]QJT94081.1 Fe-S protein assembly chaperone HscA [Wolbachia endosymbiont of Diaphorina citri]QJT95322.1 Fe-S protein assembly chaperone HscA [Wolbachia endosymbiont of Diaphorina citri]QJT96684.1 Fe-S protein assembly chaperone HscA [Wolbachia endosymbiont of Diaphorina citri]QLK10980.1 Fe-S protein assembly chaperone HscA [Wolbachia endosymbiont of Diaphorina citri]QXY87487.1 Fe-S protein assembly chaperone Hsc
MRPVQISEPNSNEVVFGIDLGTTNSLIAVVNKSGGMEIFKDEQGRELLPSVISYENDVLKVGYDVGKNAISSIKRLMGKSVKDLHKEGTNFEIDNEGEKVIRIKCSEEKYLTPVEISAEVLKALCKRVKKSTGMKVNKAVITVPAYFDDSARNATKYAAKLAGIEVLRLVNEPTAAALSYSIEKNNNSGIYAIYDLGGGTFDISILKLHQGVFQVLAVGGDTKLGGDDFDHLLSLIVLDKYRKKVGLSESVIPASATCMAGPSLIESRIVKEYLSENTVGTFEFNINGKPFKCEITKEEFEQAIGPLVNKTINIVTRTMSNIDLKIDDIKGLILVGGATRVPLVQNSLIKLFGNKVLNDVDPDKAVANGAALQAHYLTSNSKDRNILLDVLPLSLGIETMGGIVEKIIPRNTPLPVSEIKEFTTYANGQTAMKIHVCQGEREMIKDNKSLARFELKGIPQLPAGSAKVEIGFTVSIDGILTVTAREKTTGVEQTVEINSSSGLNEEDIQDMVNQSVSNFDEDMKARSLAEAKINGNKLIHLVENVSTEQKLKILLQNVKDALQKNDLDNINNAIAELENSALELCESSDR